MNKYQRLATNTFLMSIGTFGSKLLVFLMVRFYTGYLTPAEYGTADLITQTANLLIPMVSLDITDGVFRFAADRQNGRTSVFTVGLRIIMLGSAGMLLVIFLLRRIPAVQTYGMLLASFVMGCAQILCEPEGMRRCLRRRDCSIRHCSLHEMCCFWQYFTGVFGAMCFLPQWQTL